jgi:hypothetical protein
MAILVASYLGLGAQRLRVSPFSNKTEIARLYSILFKNPRKKRGILQMVAMERSRSSGRSVIFPPGLR